MESRFLDCPQYSVQPGEIYIAHNCHISYWINISHLQAKEQFITSVLKRRGKDSSTSGQQLTANDLSEFYRAFLDENRGKHQNYNVEWHMKNLSLLWPGIKANISRFKKKICNM